MTKTNREKRNQKETGYYGSYTIPYHLFKHYLLVLRELNKELPQLVKQIKHKRERQFEKKIEQLDKESEAELKNLLQTFEELRRIKLGEADLKVKSQETLRLFIEKLQAHEVPTAIDVFVREMGLVYLIAKFENFLKRILEITFREKPEILMTSQKSITFEEILKLKKYNDITKYLIEKETSSIITQDITDMDRYFEQKFNVKLSRFRDWKKFKERFYRRNILIHNEGTINRLYRLKTGYQGKDIRVEVSLDYLSDSIKLFEEMTLDISRNFYEKFK